ncbi:O-antigen ligase domain-containing protein [Phytoactinopolyspora alkaliphila]|uniref:O-antigen ligase domain-containing protein n=1 Tax=Phytoactinopolyspora alkaliphila TaxID=1783498 RepID=A0A6N9YJM1_9ACTN|nr:O-antigen ligase family protein [Phytoactinopolyspora alkaliphila]NED95088.1 O-antigen ligase domain-containing protein [Phytoactinopolyspora alkaliphila]
MAQQPLLIRRWQFSAAGLLIAYLLLQFLIPARLVIGGMGAVGRPSVAVGLMLLFLWGLAFMTSRGLPSGVQPVRWIVGWFIALQLFGYAVGFDRGLPHVESSSANRWLIFTFAMAGIALATADGISSRRQLDRLLMILVGLAGLMGLIGALQFTGIINVVEYIRIPGLRPNADLIGIGERGGPGFARVASTASHYIEFGVVLAMVLPIALHYAFFATTRRQRIWRWAASGLIAVGIPFSISRSATLAIALALVLMAMIWPWRQRYNAAIIGGVAVVAFHAVQPGVLGTIRALFTNVDNDPSVQDRIARRAYVMDLWEERPLLGRGAGSYVIERYTLLDNQLYVTLIEGGVIGVIGVTIFFIVPYFVARSIRLRGVDQQARHLAQALATVPPVALLASGTFDSFYFGTFMGVLFIAIGAMGALWRLDGGGAGRRPLQVAGPDDRFVATPLMANWKGPTRRI